MKNKILFFCIGCLLFQLPGRAQVNHDFGTWNTITLTTPVTDRVKVMFDTEYRYREDLPDNLVFRPSIGFNFTEGLSGWIGYDYFEIDEVGPGFFGNAFENRVWEQLSYRKNFSWVELVGRTRLEERFFGGTDTDDISIRHRFLAKSYFRIPKTNRKFWIVASDELFFDYNDALGGRIDVGYEQNRFFVGLNFRPTKYVSIEGGYQMQHLEIPNTPTFRTPNAINHGLLVRVDVTTPQLFK